MGLKFATVVAVLLGPAEAFQLQLQPKQLATTKLNLKRRDFGTAFIGAGLIVGTSPPAYAQGNKERVGRACIRKSNVRL
jgi:hypothetical protein